MCIKKLRYNKYYIWKDTGNILLLK